MYINTHPEIRELLIILGKESDAETILECCQGQKYQKLTLCYFDKEQQKELSRAVCGRLKTEGKTIDYIEISDNELQDYHPENEGFAIFADGLSEARLIETIIQFHPDFFVCSIDEDQINAFSIWEKGRKVIEHFYIVTRRKNTSDEVLLWNRDWENNIELSVVFPVYNVAPYLSKCVESISQWQADYVEYLFVNDGSPDNSAEIIREYAKKDPRIKLLEKQNGGCASAREYGMNEAKGKYIGFIDPDDYIEPTMFQKLLSRAMTGSYDIAYCGYRELYEENGETEDIDDVLGFPYCQGTSDPHKINELIAFRRIAIWRGIYARNMINKYNIHFHTDIRRFDDLPFKVETLAVAKSVVCVPEYLYYYRMSRPGQDVSADDERLYVHFPIFQYLNEFINKRKIREQVDYLQFVKVQTHEWALKKIKPQYMKEYVRQARKDLLSNMTARESRVIVKRFTTRKTRLYHLAILNNMPWAIRILNERGSSGDRRTAKQVEKLNQIAYGKSVVSQ